MQMAWDVTRTPHGAHIRRHAEGNQMGSGISRAEGPAKSHSLHTALRREFFGRCTTLYQQFLDSPMVHNIATIPRRAIHLQMPTGHGMTAKILEHIQSMTYIVFAVAYTCGLDTYLDERQLREGLHEMIVRSGL